MPNLSFSQALTANQLGFNPLSGWQYEFVPIAYPAGAAIGILLRSTTTGARVTVLSGGQVIQERAPIQGGGTAGVTPSPLNTTPLTFRASANDRIKILIDEVAGGTPTIDGMITLEPM
jgi:hypothetical protein